MGISEGMMATTTYDDERARRDAGRRVLGSGRLGSATVSWVCGVGLLAFALVLGAVPAGASSTSSGLAQAKKSMIVKSDLPAGWIASGSVSTDSGGSGSTFPGEQDLASCLGVSKSLIELNEPSATSPSFMNEAGADTVTENLGVFSSSKVASQEYAAISKSSVPHCLTTVLRGPAKSELQQQIGAGATLGKVTVTATPHAALVPHSSGFTMSVPITASGKKIQSYITVVTSARGRFASQLTFTSVRGKFPTSLEKHLVSVAYNRE
jgi:hypothetical protein